MARTTTPSFVRDPDQAAELAALLRDTVTELANDLKANRDSMTQRQQAQEDQTIARYRRWADELDPPADEPAGERPTHIRPARDYPQAAGDA